MKDNKDTDKLKNFRMKVDKNTDMFGKPQEIPMAKDAVDIKSPIMGTTYGMDEVSEDFKPYELEKAKESFISEIIEFNPCFTRHRDDTLCNKNAKLLDEIVFH